MADRPRTFAEVVAATDPAELAWLERAERYGDPAVRDHFHADVWFIEDRHGNGEWRVGYQDDDGGCYVTVFAGPEAEQRAGNYWEALRSKQLSTVRAKRLDVQ